MLGRSGKQLQGLDIVRRHIRPHHDLSLLSTIKYENMQMRLQSFVGINVLQHSNYRHWDSVCLAYESWSLFLPNSQSSHRYMCLISTFLQKLHSAFTFYVFELTSSSGGEEVLGCTATAVLLFQPNVNIFHESFFLSHLCCSRFGYGYETWYFGQNVNQTRGVTDPKTHGSVYISF